MEQKFTNSILKKGLGIGFVLLAFLVLGSASLLAQGTIKGKIIDRESKAPLVGASVSIPSLRIGAITDTKGQFTFESPKGEFSIEAKYIGYETVVKKVTVQDGKTATVDFDISSRGVQTNEIIVVGLTGEVDRNSLGNVISSVSGKDVAKVVSSSAIDAISGRVTGVTVTKNSGTPGAGTYITMRGRKTISGSSEPLYVVDGVILDNTSLYDPSGTKQFSNRAVDINPQDIESIEILKGASAAAIYGSQATNGVVLITTKRGKISSFDKPATITFSASTQFDEKSGTVPLQTTYGQRVPWTSTKTGSSDSYGEILPEGTKTYDQAAVPFRTGTAQEYSLSISGGVPQFDYLINGTFLDQSGYVIGSELERTSIRANVGASILPGVQIQSNSNFIAINNDLPQDGSNTSGILLGSLRTPPEFDNTDYLNADGTQRRFAGYDNPIWTQKNNTFNSQIERFIHSTEAKWQPIEWMAFAGRIGLDQYAYSNIERLAVGSANSPARGGLIEHHKYINRQVNLDLTATFNQKFFDDQLFATFVIGSQIMWSYNTYDYLHSEITLPFFDEISAGASKDLSSVHFNKKLVGIFGQFTGTMWDRISITAALRRDGSSTFGLSEKFHYYPKFGFSYVLSNESFMEGTKDIINEFRIRASYGEAGSPNLPGIYATNFLYGTAGFFDPWDRESNSTRGGFNGIRQGGGTTDEYVVAGAENIMPERSIEREIGCDISFFDNLFKIEFSYYYENIYDMIINVPLPTSTGYDMQLRNAASMWNEGIEIGLSATPVNSEDFSWTTTINYSTNKNEVTSLNISPDPTGDEFFSLSGGFTGINNVAMVGRPLGIFRGYGWLRDEAGNIVYTTWNAETQTVENDYWGLNYVGAPVMTDELQVIGDPNPDFQWSWRNDFTFLKDFTLSILVDAVVGFDVWNGTKGALFNFGKHGETEDRDELWINDLGQQVMDYTDPTDPQPATKVEKYWTVYNGFNINEPHIEDGSFIKLREISLDYRWHGLADWNINTVVFSFSARNLLTITDYTGYDPEVNTFSLAEGRGFDYFTLPQVQSFRFGISIIY